jgi:integrase
MPNSLAPILCRLYESRTNEFVLPRITKGERGEQARELQIFLFMIGLPKIRFHDLRSTYCTILLNRGVERAKVMMLAGFADLKTLAIYMRKMGILLKESTKVLDDFVTE